MKIRLTADEQTALTDKADKAGMTTAAFLRAAGLGSAGPRAQRRVPVAAALLREVLGHLGKVGSNLNQIARHLNTGREGDQVHELRAALNDYARMRDMIYEALGKAPDPPPPPSKFLNPPPAP